MMESSYHGASKQRGGMRAWRPGSGSPNSDTLPEVQDLRSNCRDLARNNPIAAAALNTNVTHVIGTGLELQPRIDADLLGLSEDQAKAWQDHALAEFHLWANSTDCDAGRRLNFYQLQELAFRSALTSGDVIALTPSIPRSNRPYTLSVQLVEADRVSNPGWRQDSETLAGGMELDSYGATIAAHITRAHPGDEWLSRGRFVWDRIPIYSATGRRNVLHIYRPDRPGQIRGVPYLAPVIEPLKQMGRYTEAELQAAVTSGAFSVFMKMDPSAFQDLFDQPTQKQFIDGAQKWDGELQYGKAINLLPGEEPVTSNPGRPNAQYDPFMQACATFVGMALEMPKEVLLMHFQSSYSAARGALLMAWRVFRTRRAWFGDGCFCQPIYELFLEEAVALGRIIAPGFLGGDPLLRQAWAGAEWIGDGPGSIDPEKEVKAARGRVDLGISTLAAESLLYDGVSWEQKHTQRVREKQARDEAGLSEEADPGPSVPTPT